MPPLWKQYHGRVERGLMVCHEKHQNTNAEVNGAINILNVAVNKFPSIFSTHKEETSGSRLMAQPLLFRWNHHEWRWILKKQESHTIYG